MQAVVHELLQQKPSTQKPLLHSVEIVQFIPFDFLQTPALQMAPGTQSCGSMHMVRQAVGPQTYAPQLTVPLFVQAPKPLQVSCLTSTPPMQDCMSPQKVPAGYLRH